VVTCTDKAWRCRSSCKDALQHDYYKVSCIDDVLQWVRSDVGRSTSVVSRKEALEYMSTLSDYNQNFLLNTSHARALEHLEEGW